MGRNLKAWISHRFWPVCVSPIFVGGGFHFWSIPIWDGYRSEQLPRKWGGEHPHMSSFFCFVLLLLLWDCYQDDIKYRVCRGLPKLIRWNFFVHGRPRGFSNQSFLIGVLFPCPLRGSHSAIASWFGFVVWHSFGSPQNLLLVPPLKHWFSWMMIPSIWIMMLKQYDFHMRVGYCMQMPKYELVMTHWAVLTDGEGERMTGAYWDANCPL